MLSLREELAVYHPALLTREAVRADLPLQGFSRLHHPHPCKRRSASSRSRQLVRAVLYCGDFPRCLLHHALPFCVFAQALPWRDDRDVLALMEISMPLCHNVALMLYVFALELLHAVS